MKNTLSIRSGLREKSEKSLSSGYISHRLPSPLYLRALLAAGIFCLLNSIPSFEAESAIKLKEINGCLWVVPVNIDGKGPFDFIIDTGSDDVAIDLDLVRELDIKPTSMMTLITSSGSRDVPAGYPLHNVQLGSQRIESINALAMDLPALKQHRIRGILGQSFLAQFNYLLNIKKREMTIEEGNELSARLIGNSAKLNYQKLDGRWMIQVSQKVGRTMNMVLDAGANEVVMYDTENLDLDIDHRSLRSVHVATNLGSRDLRAAYLRHFEVAGIMLRNLVVVLDKNGKGDEAHPEDGLLPARLFDGIYFNHSLRQVVLNPKFDRTIQMMGN